MDQYSEGLIRACIHDLANTLSGAQGILDLSDPATPLSPLERTRLESVLSDGMTILGRARHLAMSSFPEPLNESGAEWRTALQRQLSPLSAIFRCAFDLRYEGDPLHDKWPGDLLREYVHSITRVLLPFSQGGRMNIRFQADHAGWQIAWSPVTALPEALDPVVRERPRDITALWALQLGKSIGAPLAYHLGVVSTRIPRF